MNRANFTNPLNATTAEIERAAIPSYIIMHSNRNYVIARKLNGRRRGDLNVFLCNGERIKDFCTQMRF